MMRGRDIIEGGRWTKSSGVFWEFQVGRAQTCRRTAQSGGLLVPVGARSLLAAQVWRAMGYTAVDRVDGWRVVRTGGAGSGVPWVARPQLRVEQLERLTSRHSCAQLGKKGQRNTVEQNGVAGRGRWNRFPVLF